MSKRTHRCTPRGTCFYIKVQELSERANLFGAARTSVTAEYLAVSPLIITISTMACQPVNHL